MQRVEAPLESLAKWVGYLALLAACTGMLWDALEVPVKPSRDWLLALYGIAAVGIGINLVFGLIRQHFVLDDSPRNPLPAAGTDRD